MVGRHAATWWSLTTISITAYNKPIMWAKQTRGFTIFELMVVILVVGILAAVTLVLYNGSQDRARFGSYKNDIVRINEAITVYYGEKGVYPLGDGSSASGCITGTGNFMPNSGLSPSYINPMPNVPNYKGGVNYYAYCWSGNGADYKVLRLVSSGTVPSVEQDSSVTMDPNRGWRGWGFWSPGGSTL